MTDKIVKTLINSKEVTHLYIRFYNNKELSLLLLLFFLLQKDYLMSLKGHH